jgi:hypothetical protein
MRIAWFVFILAHRKRQARPARRFLAANFFGTFETPSP